MSDTWDTGNLPENFELLEKVEFVAMTEDTWKRKDNDGKDEVAPKWNYISKGDEAGASQEISVYSPTDKEELKLNVEYDLIVKRAVGKDGTFYGYTLKGFGEAGKPIPRKEPQSRFKKGLQLNAKAEALKAAATINAGSGKDPDEIIMVAEIFEAYIEGKYTSGTEKPDSKTKK